MSLVNTTLAAACGVNDSKITVAAATGIAAGYKIHVGDEDMQVSKGYVASSVTVPVLRGQSGTIADAHASGAQVTVGSSADWSQTGAPQTVTAYPIAGRARVETSISADGAIPLPPAGADAVCVITGTAHTGLTLALPTKDLNLSRLTIMDLTAAVHVVTIAAGLNGSSLDTLTFDTAGTGAITLMAYNELWVYETGSGSLTGIDVAIST